jgi:hypothetical protein
MPDLYDAADVDLTDTEATPAPSADEALAHVPAPVEATVNPDKPTRSLLIGVPTLGVIRMEWHIAVTGAIIPCNWGCGWQIPFGYLTPDAQNVIAHTALTNKADWLLLIEDDVLIPPDFFIRMERWIKQGDVPIVSGLYHLKNSPTREPLVYRGRGNGAFRDFKYGDAVWVDGVTTGCLLIHMSLIRAMAEIVESYEVRNGSGSVVIKKIFDSPRLWAADPATGNFAKIMGTSDLYFCFPPDAMVYGDMQPIAEYQPGQEVVAHSGWLRPVTDTITRQYDGPMVRIDPHYGAGFTLTPNHPVQVERDDQSRAFVPASDVRVGDRLVVPVPKRRVHKSRIQALPAWPTIRGTNVEFHDAQFRYNARSPWFPLSVPVTPDLCALCGYWVAEGSARDGVVTFTFHDHEEDYATDVRRLLQQCFGLSSTERVYHTRRVRVITCLSTALQDFLIYHFGRKSHERKVPEAIIMGATDRVVAFLRAFWRGDGDKPGKTRVRLGLSTTSKALAHSLRFMLIRLKIYPSFYEQTVESTRQTAYSVVPSQTFSEAWHEIIGLGHGQHGPRKRKPSPWIALRGHRDRDQYFSVVVEQVTTEPYSGPVLNLTVDTDHTYNVHGFAVHNCDQVIEKGLLKRAGWTKVAKKKWPFICDSGIVCDHIDRDTGQRW